MNKPGEKQQHNAHAEKPLVQEPIRANRYRKARLPKEISTTNFLFREIVLWIVFFLEVSANRQTPGLQGCCFSFEFGSLPSPG